MARIPQLRVSGRHESTNQRRGGDWRAELPFLSGDRVTLREVMAGDVPALFAAVSDERVARHISTPPPNAAGFDRFIAWAHRTRAEGRVATFAIVPPAATTAVGFVQLRELNSSMSIAEWGVVLGSDHWGTGLFPSAAQLFFEFAFDAVGVTRLEGRVTVDNGRANGALRKLGLSPEGVMRRSFREGDRVSDQVLWSLLREDACWRSAPTPRLPGRLQ